MKMFESELSIPEFENVPCKEARGIWRQFYLGNRDWFNITIMIGPLSAALFGALGAAWFPSQALSFALCGGLLGYDIHRQIMIQHLRPKIREHLRSKS